jgi:Glycosyl hydrolase family 48/Cellulose binding domain
MRFGKFSLMHRKPPRAVALAAAGALVVVGAVVVPAAVAYAAPGCSVTYTKTWDNGSGFGAAVAITNTGDPITNGWNLTFTFPGSQQITQLWPVAFTQTGANVTISSNADWNKAIGTGQTFTPGFNGNYTGVNADPTSFTLNGTVCGGSAPSLVVTPTSISVPEGGMTTYAVHLSSAPSANVTVTSARTAGDSDVTVTAGGTLTFTPSNFATNQNVTVSAAEDADTTNGTATITVSATGGIASTTVAATEADNDPGQAIIVSPTALSVPEGATATFGVRLQSAPSANVTVTCAVATAGDTDITVSGTTGTKTFTPANFATPQNVTVAAAEDADSTNGSRVINCTSSGLTTVPVTATEADNDPAQQAIVVSSAGVTVPEGGTATFGVRLAVQPSSNVTVTCSAGTGDTDITVSAGGTLTFTSANWNVNQNVTLAAAEDPDNTNGSRTINCASAGLTTVPVTATEADNDPAQAIVVSPSTLNVPEGSTAIFGVRLAAQPAGNVTVTCTAGTGDTDITVSGTTGTKTFTPTNFNVAQNVTLAAAEDADSANGVRTVTCASTGLPSVDVTATELDNDAVQNTYLTEFQVQYDKIKNPANGYFSPEGIPYHSVETLMVEAPDHGHETTSEAFSFWMWLEAQFGRVTGNWAPFNNAWNITEQSIIPTQAGQPGGQTSYNPSDPADYAPEFNQPSQYPAPLSTSVVAGSDPLAGELQSTYGNRFMYAMHWIIDVDNTYGYGNGRGASLTECGDSTPRVTYINTYQRGPDESVWETVPHPSCDTERFGAPGAGYPPLFIQGSTGNQWRYTDAPDADARAVQAAYWALTWATQQNNQSQISASVAKAAKLGDFLRYAFYDKYFKNPGCTNTNCTPGSGKSSSTGLLTWYFAWGGALDNAWSWRIGSSHAHGGYQNPLAAWAMSAGPATLHPLSPTASTDWAGSLTRQLQFYTWLQSNEGAIAGGATNSWDGQYAQPPAGTPTFFGMAYQVAPVYHDPPSNQWFGFQAWGMQRMAEYYDVTNDANAKAILDKWVGWATSNTTLGTGSTFAIPNELDWSGAPAASFSSATGMPGANPGLHVMVRNTSQDVGVAAAYARTLIHYANRAGATTLGTTAKNTAKGLLDRLLLLKEDKGISVCESRSDYERFNDVWDATAQKGLFVPSSFNGTMPNGDTIHAGSTFLSIRSFYTTDQTPTCTGGAGSGMAAITAFMNNQTTTAPAFRYHRFWAQADIAMALADFGSLFPNG